MGNSMMEIRRRVLLDKPQIITHTPERLITFDTDMTVPLKKLKVNIEPVQDLHGYSNPWPGGGGKNLLNTFVNTQTIAGITYTVNADGTISTSGTVEAGSTSVLRIYQSIDASSDVILNGCPFGGSYVKGYCMLCCDINGSPVGGIDVGSGGTTLAENVSRIRQIQIVIRPGVNADGLVFKPMVRLASVSDDTYEPYSNICPITGWDGVNVKCGGADYTKTGQTNGYRLDGNGGLVASVAYTTTDYIDVHSCSKILFGSTWDSSAWIWRVAKYDSNKDFISETDSSAMIGGVDIALDVGDEYYVRVSVPYLDVSCYVYAGNTYDITLPTEAGTVYGGTLDVSTGELVVDRAVIASYNGESLPGEWISDRDVYASGTTPTTGAQVVYTLATPITYTLSPTEIRTLLGQNNVWSDAGNIELSYWTHTP